MIRLVQALLPPSDFCRMCSRRFLSLLLTVMPACTAGLCECTSSSEVREFIRTSQRLAFKAANLDPKQYRSDEVERLKKEDPSLFTAVSGSSSVEVPNEYEHPVLYPYLEREMEAVSKLGSVCLEEMELEAIGPRPIVATVPGGLASPQTVWHPKSESNVLFFGVGTYTLLRQLANVVGQAIPFKDDKAVLSMCAIRPRINSSAELKRSFGSILESYVYEGDMRETVLYRPEERNSQLATQGLFHPAMMYLLAHEYTHAALGHTRPYVEQSHPEGQCPAER